MRRVNGADDAWGVIENYSEILRPKDADEPILGGSVRGAIFEWLTEIRSREELEAMKIKPRYSALLYGPPGCGKTTLAHHLAARLDLPLICVGAEHLVSSFLGATGQNIAKVFQALEHLADKSIVLFDEIDSIGAKRSGEQSGANTERNSFLTVLLTRMEAFQGIFMAATNRDDTLDPALWRRFGMQIDVALPGDDERYAILARYLDPYEINEPSLALLTDVTQGASPSLLRQLMEGIKRAIVLGPKLKRDIEKPVPVIKQVIASIAPPPGMPAPHLWRVKTAINELKDLQWPPTLKQ